MEWFECIRNAIDYIEASLEGEIDFEEVAKKAFCSTFYFSRIFSILTGVTVVEYVRRRRLTLAAQELQSGDKKITDIALKYGYDSPDAFTRAFHKIHGISPSAARSRGTKLVAYPRITFQIIIKGGIDMNYRIIQKDEFTVAGISKRFPTNSDDSINVPEFWTECKSNGTYDRLTKSLCRGKMGAATKGESLGICIGEKDGMTYVIGVEKPEGDVPDDIYTIKIPAFTWAVFSSVGSMPGAIQAVWKKIYEEWFPSTGYERANTPDMEVYMPGDMDSDSYYSEIWVPIIEK